MFILSSLFRIRKFEFRASLTVSASSFFSSVSCTLNSRRIPSSPFFLASHHTCQSRSPGWRSAHNCQPVHHKPQNKAMVEADTWVWFFKTLSWSLPHRETFLALFQRDFSCIKIAECSQSYFISYRHSYDRSRKFRSFIGSSFALQRLSDRVCLEHALSVVERPKLSVTSPYFPRLKTTFYLWFRNSLS